MRLRATRPRPIPRLRRAGWVPSNITLASASEVGTSLGAANAQTLPSGSVSGDLIIGVAGSDNPAGTDISVSTGWTILGSQVQGSNVIKGAVFARVLDGGANDTLAVSGAAQDYVVALTRVPAAAHGVETASIVADIPIATGATGASGNADPPSLDAGSTKDWLWFVAAIVDMTTGNAITAIPTGYTQLINTKSANSTSSVGVATGWRKIAASQVQDPDAFANNTQEWIGFTFAVSPPGASTVNATAAATLPGMVATAAATVSHTATAASTLPGPSATVSATVKVLVVASAALGGITATVNAVIPVLASASATLPGPAATASAVVSTTVTASAAVTIPGPTGTALATVTHPATAAATLPGVTATASAGVSHTATAAATLPGVTATALATPTTPSGTVTAAASATLPGPTGTALASVSHTATGTATLPGATATAAATVKRTATATATLPGVTGTGLATVTHQATATATLPGVTATVVINGDRPGFATISFTAADATISFDSATATISFDAASATITFTEAT
jgi:hypothetical protein